MSPEESEPDVVVPPRSTPQTRLWLRDRWLQRPWLLGLVLLVHDSSGHDDDDNARVPVRTTGAALVGRTFVGSDNHASGPAACATGGT